MADSDVFGLSPPLSHAACRPARGARMVGVLVRLLQSEHERIQSPAVRENLIRVLFGRPANILMVGLAILACGAFGFVRGDGVVWLAIGVGGLVWTIGRCAVIMTFNRRFAHTHCPALDPWIVGFGLSAIVSAVLWGVFTLCLMMFTTDPVLFTIALVVNTGTAGAIAARNAAAPRIAKGQLLASLVPIMVGSLLTAHHAYRMFFLLIPALLYGLFVLVTDLYERLVELFRSQEKLSALSNIDPLTLIANRRHFAARSLDALQICRRGHQPLAVLMVDVDYFKAFNDNYGHQAGDLCLQRVATILKDNLRNDDDVVARYGGEEFAIYLINAGPAEAKEVAQRLCDQVANAGLTHGHRPDAMPMVTVSVGVVATDELYGGLDSLVYRADKALYRAKMTGRNRVDVAQGYEAAG